MMADYIFTQHGNNNVQIGDVAGMDYSVKTALKWALEQNFQSVAAQYARTLGYEVDRQIKEITALREDITSARSEQARLQSENETLWGEIGYVNGDQVDAARFFHEQRNEIAALRAERDAAQRRAEAAEANLNAVKTCTNCCAPWEYDPLNIESPCHKCQISGKRSEWRGPKEAHHE